MATTRISVATTWTDLGPGPMAVGLNRGRMFFAAQTTAPTDDRTGYLHAAQGLNRLVSFAGTDTVYARAVEATTTILRITGALSATTPDPASVASYRFYADLPDPTTVDAGTMGIVLDDPNDVLRGLHLAVGPVGGNAEYWQAAS
ncbi:MAG: hypothetical protein AAF822_03365 [Pseudomonadota bacterium]